MSTKRRRGPVQEPGLDVLGPLQDVIRQMREGKITPAQLQAFAEHSNPFEVAGGIAPTLDLGQPVADWRALYKEVFGLGCDFSGLKIPERRLGFDRLLVIAQGLTAEQLFRKCQELFRSWKYTNADLKVTSDRNPSQGAYAIWVRDRVEADRENKNRSADALTAAGVSGITLEERFVYELKYFEETGKHLDLKNGTLCTGSRFADGSVPGVSWNDGKLDVLGYSPGGSRGRLRAREVVSVG